MIPKAVVQVSIRSSDLKITFGEVPEADKDSAQLNDDDDNDEKSRLITIGLIETASGSNPEI